MSHFSHISQLIHKSNLQTQTRSLSGSRQRNTRHSEPLTHFSIQIQKHNNSNDITCLCLFLTSPKSHASGEPSQALHNSFHIKSFSAVLRREVFFWWTSLMVLDKLISKFNFRCIIRINSCQDFRLHNQIEKCSAFEISSLPSSFKM